MRRKLLAVVLVVAMAPMAFVGCHGSFRLTRAVYKVNSDVKNPLLRQVVYWLFMPIVYGIAAGADAYILNVIEFWSGGPGGLASATLDDGSEVAIAPGANENEAVLTYSRDGAVEKQVRFVRISDRECLVYDDQGNHTGKVVRSANGDIELINAAGVERIPASVIAQVVQAN